MRNLFGFDSEYFDKYSGLSNFEKWKKFVSKSNVDMVLNRFTPFTKSKALKAPTTTVVSIDGTDIDGVDAPIAFHKYGKENKIYVNNNKVDKRLAKFAPEEQEAEFKRMMRGAYVARGDIESINNRTNIDNGSTRMHDLVKGVDDHGMTEDKLYLLQDIHRQILLAGQMIQQGCHVSDSAMEPLSTMAADDGLLSLSHTLATGVSSGNAWADNMKKRISECGKQRSEYNKWADEVNAKMQSDFGAINQQDMDDSEYKDVLDENLPLTPKYYVTTKPDKDNSDGKEACKVGNGKMEYNEEPQFVEPGNKNDTEFEETNDTLTQEDIDTVTQNYFFRDNEKVNNPVAWAKRDADMSRLAEALYESLVGKIGKRNSQSPAKRLNPRAIANDMNDNIYQSKVPLGGKKLDINLILDTSGSMSGYHIDDGVDIINCINKLALRGVITGNLMLTASGASSIIKLPVNDDLLPLISAHNGGEGYKHTIGLRWKELQQADYNVAITDGMLTDGHIDMTEMTKAGIDIVGLYTVRDATKNGVLRYSGSLKRWFTNSAVRKNAEEAIYYLIDNAILNYDMNPRNVA